MNFFSTLDCYGIVLIYFTDLIVINLFRKRGTVSKALNHQWMKVRSTIPVFMDF